MLRNKIQALFGYSGKNCMLKQQSLFVYLLILLFSILIALPYFHPGYFPTHDGEWAVIRLAEMFRELKDHQFPPRYSTFLNFGYGYPLFNFVYPFPYYVGTILHFFRFGFVDSVKVLFAASIFLSALCMAKLAQSLWKNLWATLTAAALYIFLPYRIVDLYARGSLGESFAFVFYPLILWLCMKVYNNPQSFVYGSFLSISLACLLVSHNITALLFFPVLLIFILAISFQNKKLFFRLLLFILLGFCLSSFFILPALLEKQNILLSKIPIADRNIYFVRFDQLIFPQWGYGVSTGKDGFGYQIGIPQIAVLFGIGIFLVFLITKKKYASNKLQERIAFVLIGYTIVAIGMMFSFSAFLWHLPLLSEINYPWIMLLPIGFLLALLSGFLIIRLPYRTLITVLLVGVAMIMVLPFAKPSRYVSRADSFYLTNDATTTSSSELMPLWVKIFPTMRPAQAAFFVKGNGTVNLDTMNSKQEDFSVSTMENSILRINTIYYPGWKVKVDNKIVPVGITDESGVMEIQVPKGSHHVQASFSETPLRIFADLLSFIALLGLIGMVGFSMKKRT